MPRAGLECGRLHARCHSPRFNREAAMVGARGAFKRRAGRMVAALAVLMAAAAAAPATGSAGVYPVNSCSPASGFLNRSWAARVNNSAPGYDVRGTFVACSPTDAVPFMQAKLDSVTTTGT